MNAALKRINTSTVFGHGHRGEQASKTVHTFEGTKIVSAYMVPCACHIDGRVPGKVSEPNWQGGFGWMQYSLTQSIHHFQAIQVIDGEALYDGVHYMTEEEPVLAELAKAYPQFRWEA